MVEVIAIMLELLYTLPIITQIQQQPNVCVVLLLKKVAGTGMSISVDCVTALHQGKHIMASLGVFHSKEVIMSS